MKRSISVTVFIISLGFTAVLFQNCAEPLDLENQDLASSSSAYDGTPFAYNYKADHVSYMSCSDVSATANKQAYFSFKAGSFGYNSSGLSLRQDFLSQYSNSNASAVKGALMESPANRDAQIQLALRQKTNLHSFYREGSSSGDEGEDYDNVAVPLANERIADKLASNPNSPIGSKYFSRASEAEGVNFPGAQGASANHLFGQLNFTSSENLANLVRTEIINNNITLAATFANINSANPLAPLSPNPAESHKYAYGRTYDMSFSLGHGLYLSGSTQNPPVFPSFTNAVPKVISAVSERNLENLQSEGQWVCPAQLRFVVVRPEDNANSAFCGYNNTPDGVNTPKQILANRGYTQETPGVAPAGVAQDHYIAARNILPMEHWNIDFKRRCIVPKTTQDQCYGSSINFTNKPINYSAGPMNGGATGACGTSSTCPHYVSVCYKVQ